MEKNKGTGRTRLFDNVINKSLCSGCGTCIGICPVDAIKYNYKKNIPIINNQVSCVNCNKCVIACPGLGFKYVKNSYDEKDVLSGNPILFGEAFAKDETIRKHGTSGGTVTGLLHYLLENHLVDNVVVLSTKDSDQPSVEIIENVNQLNSSHQQSKYYSAPLNKALKDIMSSNCKWAVVGLPCHIQGIEKALQVSPNLEGKIEYKLGLFCGYSVSGDALKSLREYLKIDESWKLVGWRIGDYPGYVTFTKNGRDVKILIYEALNIIDVYYANNRCFYCADGTNQSSDISFGDIHAQGNKSNVVIAYTQKGKELLEKASNYIHFEAFNKSDKRYRCIDGIIQAKRIKALYNIHFKNNFLPDNDIFYKDIKKYVSIKNSIIMFVQRLLIKLVRLKPILMLIEKNPKLQMRIGRYIYTYPSRVMLLRVVHKLRKSHRM